MTMSLSTVMSGKVLALSAHETLLSWDDEHAVVALKAFNYGPAGSALAIHGFGYGMSSEDAADHESRFGASLERLLHCFARSHVLPSCQDGASEGS